MAALASLATLPVLVAHGMSTSLVGIVCNVLVVWMLQPALQMGILLLIFSAVPFLLPLVNLTGLALSLWLKAMLGIVERCCGMPFASVYLPQRYSCLCWRCWARWLYTTGTAKGMRVYPIAALICTAAAVVMGIWMQRDVVEINLVGASNNPCVVCVQNGQAVVLFRGGESNLSAVERYLAGRSRQEPAPPGGSARQTSALDFTAAEVVTMQAQPGFDTRTVLDGLTLDLYHNKKRESGGAGHRRPPYCGGGGQHTVGRTDPCGCTLCAGGAVRCRAGGHDP